jgi:hypothetical protein
MVDGWNISGWETAMAQKGKLDGEIAQEKEEGSGRESGLGFGPKSFIYKHGGEWGSNGPQCYSKDLVMN